MKQANKTDSVINSQLPEKQRRLIPYIVNAHTVEAGCEAAGITATTYYTYMKIPAFVEAIRDARNELVSDSMEKLKGNVSKAVDNLVSLLESSNEEVKRKSANDIINIALRWREMGEVESRLESIEKIILERRIYR